MLTNHESLELHFGGGKPTAVNISPSLFTNLSPNVKPIAVKSRWYNNQDKKFIESEIQCLLKENVIEPSTSPWRAQVVIVSDDHHKKCIVIDYSQTINRFTELDAYPLPRIGDQANKIAQYKIFSNIDLKDACYQIPIKDSEKQYIAFEPAGKLYKHVPFGVTNAVSCFQREIDYLILENSLIDTFAYLDNLIISGSTQEEYDQNLAKFTSVKIKKGITNSK